MLLLRFSNHTQSFSKSHHLLKASWLNWFVSPQIWHVGCCCKIIKGIFQPGGKNNRVLSSCGAWGEILEMLGLKSSSKSSKWWCSCWNAQGCRSWTQIGKTTNGQSNSCTCSSPCILPLIYITASPPPDLFLSSPVKHFLQATVSITSLSSNHPPTSSTTPSSPVLPFSTLLCRIGEAYRLATTIKVQQVSGGSCHHQSKLHKPYCDRRIYARRGKESDREGGLGAKW